MNIEIPDSRTYYIHGVVFQEAITTLSPDVISEVMMHPENFENTIKQVHMTTECYKSFVRRYAKYLMFGKLDQGRAKLWGAPVRLADSLSPTDNIHRTVFEFENGTFWQIVSREGP